MSRQSQSGMQQRRELHPSYAAELTNQITDRAERQWDTWTARGRVPLLVRAKDRLRRRADPMARRETDARRGAPRG